MKTIADYRAEYRRARLDEGDVDPDPVRQFGLWFEQAVASEIREPNAMTVATVGEGGRPSARMMLLKAFADGRFVFYTNFGSRKARELDADGRAALVFFWGELERQVRVEGSVARVGEDEADAYFASRPRDSQLGAWASAQSAALASRAALEAGFADAQGRYGDGPVPRPSHWGGYAVTPDVIEFWQGRPSRLHDRLVYLRDAGGGWTLRRLAP